MTRAITITDVDFTNANSPIRIRVGAVEKEFRDLAHLKAYVQSTLDRDSLIALALAILLDRSPTNPSVAVGKTLTVDTSLNNWGVIG